MKESFIICDICGHREEQPPYDRGWSELSICYTTYDEKIKKDVHDYVRGDVCVVCFYAACKFIGKTPPTRKPHPASTSSVERHKGDAASSVPEV